MEMLQTHCYATGTVTLLWKCYKLIVMQQALLRYYGNATGCIGHATKETQHVTIPMGLLSETEIQFAFLSSSRKKEKNHQM
jgi:hypothetical protein